MSSGSALEVSAVAFRERVLVDLSVFLPRISLQEGAELYGPGARGAALINYSIYQLSDLCGAA